MRATQCEPHGRLQDVTRWRVAKALSDLFPGYFAFVMATGVVSLAAHFQGRKWIAFALFALNLVAYIALWAVTVARFFCFQRAFINDLTHDTRGSGFLTKPAAACVLGSQFVLLTPYAPVGAGFWVFGGALSVVLGYAFFAVTIFERTKPPLEPGITGSWLLVVVAMESTSVLGTLVAPSVASTGAILFVALAMHFAGAMLYVFFATMILHRWMFFLPKAKTFTPDSWIDMGALAITTLAGTLLIENRSHSALVQSVAPFLLGLSILFWAVATWWIPLLSTVELWRHWRAHVRFNYEPDYWAMVFPLGMYAVATSMLVKVTGMNLLAGVAGFFAYVALIVWVIVFIGMVKALVRWCSRPQ